MQQTEAEKAENIVDDALNVAWKRCRWVIEDAAKGDGLNLKVMAQTIYLLGAWDGANLPEVQKLRQALEDSL